MGLVFMGLGFWVAQGFRRFRVESCWDFGFRVQGLRGGRSTTGTLMPI